MYRKGIGAYRQTDVLTADPKRLVVLCYDAIIRNMKAAKAHYEACEYEAKAKAVQKTQAIIDELWGALDYDKGGEIAKNLDSLYNYMQRRIVLGDAAKDTSAFDEVANMVSELKSAWEEAFFGNNADNAIVTTERPGTSQAESAAL